MSILAIKPARRQGPPINKDYFGPDRIPADAPGDDAPDWRDLDDVLEETALSLRQFARRHGHVGLDHRGFSGQIVIDARQLEEGGRR